VLPQARDSVVKRFANLIETHLNRNIYQ
jgi:hypothetical protein